MQTKMAYSETVFEPRDGTRRYVYVMPGDIHLVVKAFATTDGEKYTVKLWDNTLDYQRTVRSWRTKHMFAPGKDEWLKYYRIAVRLLERAGFQPHALVVSNGIQ